MPPLRFVDAVRTVSVYRVLPEFGDVGTHLKSAACSESCARIQQEVPGNLAWPDLPDLWMDLGKTQSFCHMI